jgi:hypothetical protein
MSATPTIEDYTTNIIIVKELRDYSKDPFFIKKKEEAIKFIREHGLPKSYIEKHGIPEDFKKKK